MTIVEQLVQGGARPDNKEAAFEAARNEIGQQLSRNSFNLAWKLKVPPDWKTGGARAGKPRTLRK
jgi:hypothetical protein